MTSVAGDVNARAGALMRAWRKRNLAALDGELHRAGRSERNGTKSGFEAEREELLACIASQMYGAAQNLRNDRPVCAPKIDVCLGLLEHLAARRPSPIC